MHFGWLLVGVTETAWWPFFLGKSERCGVDNTVW